MTHSPSCPGSESALLPCPFCGSSDLVLDENSYKTKWVICDGCGAQIDDSPHGDCVELWNHRSGGVAQPATERAFDRYSYDAGLMAAVGVCKAHSKWAEDKIDEKLPVEGSQNQSFATISNTADDLAEMIGDLAVSSMSSTSQNTPECCSCVGAVIGSHDSSCPYAHSSPSGDTP